MWGRKARRIEALEKQVAFLAGRNDEQAQAIAELDERNARVHRDLQAMRDRFPRLELDPSPPLWTCPVEGHTKVDWSGNVATCMTCGKQSTDSARDGRDPRPHGCTCLTVSRGALYATFATPGTGCAVHPGTTGWSTTLDPEVTRPYIREPAPGTTELPLEIRRAMKREVGPTWPEYTYEATYGPVPEAGKDEQR